MSYSDDIAILKDKYVAAVQSLTVNKEASDDTWLFLYLIGSKISYLETATESNTRSKVYHFVSEKLYAVYYNYAADNENPLIAAIEPEEIVVFASVASTTVPMDRIDKITAAVLNTRYYTHFTSAFYWYVSTLTNYSNRDEWFLAYRLQRLLRHLEISNAANVVPNEKYVDCMYDYFPESGNYSAFALNAGAEPGDLIDEITVVQPPNPGVQNLFLKIDGDAGEIEADSPETTVTFNGVGIDISFDNDNKTITFTVTSAGFYNSTLPSGTSMPTSVGGHNSGTLVSDLDGLSFSELWDILLFPPEAPTATLSGTLSKTVEVGVSIDPVLTAVFNQNGAGSQNAFSLEQDAVEVSTSSPYTATGLTSAIPAEIDFIGNFAYDAGAQIPLGNIDTNTVTYDFIYPIFYGVSADDSIDAADIIAGTKVLSGDTTPTVTFGSTSSQYIWIAVPASFATFDSWFVTQLNQGAIGTINDLFDAPTTVAVTTVNWSGIDYKLYVSNYTTESTDPMTFS